MLKHLHIENYALIESLDIDFNEGFSTITGETGAGKSILLGAIGLLTGGRADLSSIQHGKQKCIIEAIFSIENYGLGAFFQDEDLEYDPSECIIRRELASNGKSRAFINDTPTTVSALKRLGSHLIDIHSQHQNLLLGQEGFQLSVLDSVASEDSLKNTYIDAYKHWYNTVKKLAEAKNTLDENKKDENYIRFLVEELAKFQPQPGEDEMLQQQCDMLEHAQDIKISLMQGYNYLSEGDCPVLDTIRQVRNQIAAIQSFFPKAEALSERLESCRIELKDISDTLESEGENIDYDPERLEELQNRLNTLFTLEQKHHVGSSDELIEIFNRLKDDLEKIDNSDDYIKDLEKEEKIARDKINDLASQLTKSRTNVAREVENDVATCLKSLGIPNVQFKVSISPTEMPTPNGMDKVSFLFSANLGSPLQDISQVASGGETARVMLSLKAILSGAVSMPTIIFDEIDTGVSGKVAESMAKIMHQMGQKGCQVISITHLPQIAALGQHHYRVWKENVNNTTISNISYLSKEERIKEIANMLSGSNVSQEAVNNAKSLLGVQ